MSTSPIASSIPVIQIQTSETDLQRVAQMAAEQALASVAHLLRQPTEWMSASQVARWLSGPDPLPGEEVSPKTVYAWGVKGYLTAYHPTARVTRYKRSEVVAFMESGRAR